MTIYHVSYIGDDDLTHHQYFSSKAEAEKNYRKLQKYDTNPPFEDDEDERVVKMVFDLATFECDISKKGILKMLNTRFAETQ